MFLSPGNQRLVPWDLSQPRNDEGRGGEAAALTVAFFSTRCTDEHMADTIQGALLTHATFCCPALSTEFSACCCTSGLLKSCKEV